MADAHPCSFHPITLECTDSWTSNSFVCLHAYTAADYTSAVVHQKTKVQTQSLHTSRPLSNPLQSHPPKSRIPDPLPAPAAPSPILPASPSSHSAAAPLTHLSPHVRSLPLIPPSRSAAALLTWPHLPPPSSRLAAPSLRLATAPRSPSSHPAAAPPHSVTPHAPLLTARSISNPHSGHSFGPRVVPPGRPHHPSSTLCLLPLGRRLPNAWLPPPFSTPGHRMPALLMPPQHPASSHPTVAPSSTPGLLTTSRRPLLNA